MGHNKKQGFTLIELLVVIGIVGFVSTVAMIGISAVRAQSRDSKRTANMDDIGKALSLYSTNSQVGFPPSAGECLSGASGAGFVLRSAGVVNQIPTDPRWPNTTTGATISGGIITAGSGYCYYYYSPDANNYYVSYYLETDSKAGSQGAHYKSVNQ